VSEYDALIGRSESARENAHAAYSNFRVGAGLRATSGRIFGGCKRGECHLRSYRMRRARGYFQGDQRRRTRFDAIAVVADTDSLTAPCGACRQLIWEFCGDVPVVLANLKGKVEVIRMSALSRSRLMVPASESAR